MYTRNSLLEISFSLLFLDIIGLFSKLCTTILFWWQSQNNIDRKKGFHKHVDTQNYDQSDENILYKPNKTQAYFYLREKKRLKHQL
jgi:hypothetical protein